MERCPTMISGLRPSISVGINRGRFYRDRDVSSQLEGVLLKRQPLGGALCVIPFSKDLTILMILILD